MDFGLCLPHLTAGSSREGIDAAAEAAERVGWSTVWTTDHVLVDHAASTDYGRIFESLTTLAWVAGRRPGLKLGTSVIVVPQRNAVVLAKELATLDVLSEGRLIVGVGAGWSEREFANLGMAARFHDRGAYLDESIRLWRHLWSGSSEPFHGRFHTVDDFVFEPLPVRGAALPIVVGGSSAAALRRSGALGDGYHASSTAPATYAERIPVVVAAAEAAGRPRPWLTARVRARFEPPNDGFYGMYGSPEAIAAEVEAFEALGVSHLALSFGVTDPAELVALVERFEGEVMPLVGASAGGV